jgi:hypothetical protein
MGWCRRGSISATAAVATASGPKAGLIDNTREQALACVDIAKRAGLDFLVLDQTRSQHNGDRRLARSPTGIDARD